VKKTKKDPLTDDHTRDFNEIYSQLIRKDIQSAEQFKSIYLRIMEEDSLSINDRTRGMGALHKIGNEMLKNKPERNKIVSLLDYLTENFEAFQEKNEVLILIRKFYFLGSEEYREVPPKR
jgi:hypothetical protein